MSTRRTKNGQSIPGSSEDFDTIVNRKASAERGTNVTYAANNLNQYTQLNRTFEQSEHSNIFTPVYDADGNQTLVKTATGIWQVTYNGENRPILWICLESNNPNNSNNQTISMSYDRMGRRVTKNNQRFVYNGYLQIANFHSPTPTLNSNYYIWDPTEPIATRPLAWTTPTTNHESPITSFYTHDGNKNISEVIAADGSLAAHYEYSPFGVLTVRRGTFAAANPWRFSSEFADDEFGCMYFNYREYESMLGRWLGYDFIADCLNCYAWCENYIGGFDFLGLKVKVFGNPEQKEKVIELLQKIFGGVVQLNGDEVVFLGASDSLGCQCKKLFCEDPTYSIIFDDKADMYGGGMFEPEPFGGILGGGISLGSKDSYSKGNELVFNWDFPFVHLKEVIENLDDFQRLEVRTHDKDFLRDIARIRGLQPPAVKKHWTQRL